MYIKNISLSDFRNIQRADVELKNGINIFYGANANGKTNFLESIYLCSTGRSHRTKNDKELIDRIIEIRKSENISQSELAKMTGNSQQAISSFEQKTHNASMNLFASIINALGYEVQLVKR